MTPQEIENMRNPETDEILGRAPSWILRWGITIIFLIVALVVFISWLIKYPDVIKGDVILTSENPPVKIFARSNGTITKLYKADGELVRKGEKLAVIQSTLSVEAVGYLDRALDSVAMLLSGKLRTLSLEPGRSNFGEVQSSFNDIQSLLHQYRTLTGDKYFVTKVSDLKERIGRYRQLEKVMEKESAIMDDELKAADVQYNINKKLYDDAVISKTDFIQHQSAHREKELESENKKKEGILNRIRIKELEMELLENIHKDSIDRAGLTKNIALKMSEIRNFIKDWEQDYVLIAPNDGVVYYMQTLTNDQHVEANDELFAVVLENEELKGFLTVPSSGAGKIVDGQRVYIYLNNYPYHEYGKLVGRVSRISAIPKDENYRIEIDLTNGLQTTYSKKLGYTPEMPGQAEVITQDVRLIERMFNRLLATR